MQMVTVCRFRKYDINSDTWIESRRYGTTLAIAELGGKPMGNTLVDVDASSVGPDGLTGPGFNPNQRGGLQRSVKSG